MLSHPITTISTLEARKLALSHQGLLSAKPKFGRGKAAVLRAIDHLGYVQIDAISVIQRAHHHTLWSRVPGYRPQYLLDLLAKDRMIFEYWSHAASFLPMHAYRFALPVMQTIRKKGKHWYQVDPKLKQLVFERIVNEGPKYARDFETPRLKQGVMWNWKPAKKALHELFMEGRITVISREGFQRLYDIPERFIPAEIDTSVPTYEQYLWFCIKSSIRALGLCSVSEIRYQKLFNSKEISKIIEQKTAENQLLPINVNRSKKLYFTAPHLLEQLPARVSRQVHLLSPFDNMIIQRKRLNELFGFEYQTEIYYPLNKRVYGYFSMPILYGTEFIGRMDPKAHRDQKLLEVKNLVLEPHVKISDAMITKLRHKLTEFAFFNGCDHTVIKKTQPGFLKAALA